MYANTGDRVVLNNGVEMPWLGLGVYGLDDGPEVEQAVMHALEIGYRSIDTATIYRNERGVGRAIRDSGIPREDIFLTTKVWNIDQREKRTLTAFRESLKRLDTEYVDLYLVHWPVEGCYKTTWREMERIYQSGHAKAIGVSNFMQHHLEDLLSDSRIGPGVNQVEFHPRLVQLDLLACCRDHGIRVEAWSPLMHGQVVAEPIVMKVAEKYSRTPAQIVLRWDLQHGVVTIPKSGHPERIAENARIFDSSSRRRTWNSWTRWTKDDVLVRTRSRSIFESCGLPRSDHSEDASDGGWCSSMGTGRTDDLRRGRSGRPGRWMVYAGGLRTGEAARADGKEPARFRSTQ